MRPPMTMTTLRTQAIHGMLAEHQVKRGGRVLWLRPHGSRSCIELKATDGPMPELVSTDLDRERPPSITRGFHDQDRWTT